MDQAQAAPAAPLAGIVVVEDACDVAGRYCGRLFAMLGARVLRVTAVVRAQAPAVELWLDQGKEMAEAAGAWEILDKIPAAHRVVLAGQTAAAVQRIDADLTTRGLDVLRLGITWFGMTGPYRDWQGDDALIQALVGIASGFGTVDGPPMLPQGTAPQITAGATLFVGALAGLWGRRNGGEAPHRIDVDVFEAAMCFTETSPPIFERNPVEPTRRGLNRFSANHPTTVYRTSDGWLGVTTLTPAQWVALTEVIGKPDWGTDERFANSAARVANADVLDAALTEILRTNTTEHWLMEGQRRRVPLAPVPSHLELLETEHWRERGSFQPLPDAPGVLAPGLPFRMRADGKAGADSPPLRGAPLAGVTVTDFSMGWAGPLCTRLLADLGADVIKVESETHHDWWRGWEPPGASEVPAHEVMPAFLIMNRNKRGVCIDLTVAAGRAQAEALAKRADIVIENYAPGVMAKLKLDHDRLLNLRPGLVMVSMGAFGAVGPWHFFRAYGSTVEHASGMPHANGEAAWPPVLQHTAYGDPVAGLYAAIAALVGLHGRAVQGGAWFDLAQVECLFQLGADMILIAQTEDGVPRLGSRSAWMAPRCVVSCGRGWLALVCRDQQDWERLCDWLDRPAWKEWATPAERNEHGDEIERCIAEHVASLTADEAADAAQSAGVPAAPVFAAHLLPNEPHLKAAGAWVRIDRRFIGSHPMAAPVFRLDDVRPPVSKPAPTLGEHSSEVLPLLET